MDRSGGRPRVVVLAPRMRRGEITLLCDQLVDEVADGWVGTVICDVAAVVEPDMVTVETVARLGLTARRLGCRLRVAGGGERLAELLELTGLRGVVDLEPGR